MVHKMMGINCEISILFFISPEHTQSFRGCTFSGKGCVGFYTMKSTAKRTKSKVSDAVSIEYCLLKGKNNSIVITILYRSKAYFTIFANKYFDNICHKSTTCVFLYIFKFAIFACNNYCMSAAGYF